MFSNAEFCYLRWTRTGTMQSQGFCRSTVTEWITRRDVKVSLSSQIKVAKAYGYTTLDDFLDGEDLPGSSRTNPVRASTTALVPEPQSSEDLMLMSGTTLGLTERA